MILKGKAWKFGDNISTDLICPGRYYHLRSNMPELARHVLEDARGDFAPNAGEGDFIAAGRDFGLGSSREHAPAIIKMSGVSAVIAKSFARIFYRNAINVGLPVVICDTDWIKESDELVVDFENGRIENTSSGEKKDFPPVPKIMADILTEGGIVEYLKKNGDIKI
jgi:3-isopropylmalate/(R)-2-methylmalate dehydratase small subunit